MNSGSGFYKLNRLYSVQACQELVKQSSRLLLCIISTLDLEMNPLSASHTYIATSGNSTNKGLLILLRAY
ncbi:hypothetical protein BDV23DRAFT_162263 [Aspergillus alliaceus]|uniref:Uncharacterized protein n=1 Tax=Petromyces alliaceus TaxID=209559 RepID=A0A5N7BZE3_PETAA|nr:hypothetical protein BDV23DRAFT_162263 [Aspergillus alliaceus]